MSYQIDYVRKLNFPKIPEELIQEILLKLENSEHVKKINKNSDIISTCWTDDHNKKINEWCQANICDSAYFAFSIFNGQPIHKDIAEHKGQYLTTRLLYTITTGGDNIKTSFWADDKKTLLKEYVLEPRCWYLLASSTYHTVDHTPAGQYRLLLTSQMLHQYI